MSPPCLPATEGGARRGLHTGVSLTSLASVLSRLLLGSRPVGDTWCKAVDTVTKGPPLLEGTSAASLVAGCPYRTPGVGTVSSLSAPFPVLSCPTDLATPELFFWHPGFLPVLAAPRSVSPTAWCVWLCVEDSQRTEGLSQTGAQRT